MKTITAVKTNGTIWYLWNEQEGVFASYTEGVILAFVHEIKKNPTFQANLKRNPHKYGFWKKAEIETKHGGNEPILFPELMDDETRIFELLADNTDDFSWDNEYCFSLSPNLHWVFLLDLDNNMFSVYGGYKLLIDQTHHRNYDIKLELGCDGVPCYMVEFWMLDNLPDVQTLRNTCSEQF